jgi:hypothetical protein
MGFVGMFVCSVAVRLTGCSRATIAKIAKRLKQAA